MSINIKDVAAGGLFILLGLFFGLTSWFELDIGTARGMGPGYFPLVLAALLILFGLIIGFKAFGVAPSPITPPTVRGALLILSCPLIFAFAMRGIGPIPALGFIPGVVLVVLVASLASRQITPLFAIASAVIMTLFSVLVFYYGLGLPVRLVGNWWPF